LHEASTENGLKLLRKNNIIVLFPEGENGNFKPSAERYHLREFRRGFVRMAIATGAPIIPTIVIGAEETHINLTTLKLTKYLKGQIIPIPLNILPLPAKWKIKFLEPISFEGYTAKDAENSELVHKLALEVQAKMQAAIDKELKSRKWIYFAPPPPDEDFI
jgi:1-acyl-sn-glycerol-3-phosphate acyltransferase